MVFKRSSIFHKRLLFFSEHRDLNTRVLMDTLTANNLKGVEEGCRSEHRRVAAQHAETSSQKNTPFYHFPRLPRRKDRRHLALRHQDSRLCKAVVAPDLHVSHYAGHQIRASSCSVIV